MVNTEGGRHETLCLRCNSLERHRRAILFLRRSTDLFTASLHVLHVAPEPSLRTALENLSNLRYITGDLLAQDVDVQLDLTAIAFPDDTFDVVLCSHVLEHIPDDRTAMQEMRRVLKPNGWAFINVPSDPDRTTTYENSAVVSPEERLEHFGQDDHVRVYSTTDFVARLEHAGFDVTQDPEPFTHEEIRRYRLAGDVGWDHSYLCRPRHGASSGAS
ncbi:MAG: hypothetical protein QOG15_731 [Solirubrobacteraceae bacterium]|nr:hypothetical protein [Solirubrobacteraceae bacterium]